MKAWTNLWRSIIDKKRPDFSDYLELVETRSNNIFDLIIETKVGFKHHPSTSGDRPGPLPVHTLHLWRWILGIKRPVRGVEGGGHCRGIDTEALFKKGRRCLHVLRRLECQQTCCRFFFYHLVVASVILCWSCGGSGTAAGVISDHLEPLNWDHRGAPQNATGRLYLSPLKCITLSWNIWGQHHVQYYFFYLLIILLCFILVQLFQ